ncbi:MAG: hypothetical protein J1F38_09150 [Muribaculaceae bacterium]|nr:hypothetical protein [Muribaculaceae bacterium]
MKINDTISVNPSKNALGQVETPVSSIFRSQVLREESQTGSIDILQIAFPSTKSGLGEMGKYSVPLRTLFATILIVTGLSFMHIGEVSLAICSLSFGGFLALGLLTRPVMLGAAVYYCILGALSIRAGVPDISLFSMMFGCLIFGVAGAGKYSCDTIIKTAIKRNKKRHERKMKENYLGYRAFHKVNF